MGRPMRTSGRGIQFVIVEQHSVNISQLLRFFSFFDSPYFYLASCCGPRPALYRLRFLEGKACLSTVSSCFFSIFHFLNSSTVERERTKTFFLSFPFELCFKIMGAQKCRAAFSKPCLWKEQLQFSFIFACFLFCLSAEALPSQPKISCSTPSCVHTDYDFVLQPPGGQSLDEYYNFILTVLGTDGVTVDYRWVNNVTTDPNIYFMEDEATHCYLNVTFVYEVAAYRDQMGMITFNGTFPNRQITSQTVLFQEDTVDDGCLPPGATVVAGGLNTAYFINF